MQTLFASVGCLECGAQSPPDLFAGHCPACGSGWIEARYDLAALPPDWPQRLSTRPASLWRYRELLPFPADLPIVTMGEGWTPLTRAEGLERESGHAGIWIKDERQQPTGSFKDRQAALAISALKKQGITEMALASTGNAAAAYAAYCARAGIKLWVFLTSSAPAEKVRELALYGAEVVKIAGTYDQAKEVAADFAARRGIHLDGGARSITGKESMKTIAFEIAEQLALQDPKGFSKPLGSPADPKGFLKPLGSPDWYIQSVSGGIGPLGVIKGFVELYEAGLIDRVPRLGIVQVEGCAPMVRAWEQGQAKAEPVQPDTLVTVLATGKPGFAYELLKRACDRYGGAMVAVSDGDAFRAMRRLARLEGFSMEPAASVAFAGLDKLLAEGYIRPGEQVIVNCSGHTFSAEKHILEDRYFFHVDMPAAVAQPSAEGLAMALEQLDEQSTTIVVIDDNPHDTRLIRRFLENYKRYRILEAHTAAEGIELVRQRRPDLVVLDLALPGRDGFSVLNELKTDERTSSIPVVVVSGKSLKPDEWQYLRRHTDSIWQKGSFRASELVRHLAHTLGDEITLPTVRQHSDPPNDDWECAREHCPRILVVDDHVSDARLLHRLFESTHRFEVVEAHSAAEALAAVEQATPDLIILDLILPDLAGEQLLQLLRQRQDTSNVPIIVVSAKEMDAALQARLTSQTVSIWSKAVMDRSSLLAHVETILE